MIWFRIALEAAALYVFFILIALGYTGKVERHYHAIPADTTLVISGKSLLASELAKQYEPAFSLAEGLDSPPHQDLKWEAVDEADAVVLVYRAEWANETQPVWWKNPFVQLYRFPYFGLSWKDSEYLQIRVRKSDGALVDAQLPVLEGERLTAHYDFENKEVVYGKNGELVKKEPLPDRFPMPLQVEVANWDHVYKLQTWPIESAKKIDFPLVYLNDEAFTEEKYCRRDQGTYASFEPVSNFPVSLFVGAIFIVYFIFLRRGAHYKYVEGHGDVEKPNK